MPRHIALLLKLLLLGLLTGQAFRITLLLLHRDQWHDATRADVLTALFDRGLIFDLYVISWMLIVPALVLGVAHALGGTSQRAWAEARTRSWFDSTVCVIVGDHGQAFDPLHEVPIAYHHVPLVIHAPALVEPGKLSGYGTQVGLPETILALLRVPHVNNTLGKDLIAGGHAAAYFCADHRICAINDRGYLIRDRDVVRLYDHRARGTHDLSMEQPALRDSLMRHAASMVQATQAIVTRKLAGDDGMRPLVP